MHFLSPIHGVFRSTCERSHKSDSIRFSLITYFGTTYVCHIHFLWQIQLAPFTQQTNSLWRLFDERPSWTQHYVSMVPRKDPIGISTRRLSSGPSLRFRIKRTGGRDGLDLPRNFNFLMFFLDLLRLRLFLIFMCADGLAKQNHNISKGEKDAPTLGRSRRSQEIPLFWTKKWSEFSEFPDSWFPDVRTSGRKWNQCIGGAVVLSVCGSVVFPYHNLHTYNAKSEAWYQQR